MVADWCCRGEKQQTKKHEKHDGVAFLALFRDARFRYDYAKVNNVLTFQRLWAQELHIWRKFINSMRSAHFSLHAYTCNSVLDRFSLSYLYQTSMCEGYSPPTCTFSLYNDLNVSISSIVDNKHFKYTKCWCARKPEGEKSKGRQNAFVVFSPSGFALFRHGNLSVRNGTN